MSNIQTGAERMPHDLSHLGFLAGQIGRLITISTTPVIAGDSFEMDAVRSEERFSRNAETDLVCRLLLEKKKIINLFYDSFTDAFSVFFFYRTASTQIYTLSLHDALPILRINYV